MELNTKDFRKKLQKVLYLNVKSLVGIVEYGRRKNNYSGKCAAILASPGYDLRAYQREITGLLQNKEVKDNPEAIKLCEAMQKMIDSYYMLYGLVKNTNYSGKHKARVVDKFNQYAKKHISKSDQNSNYDSLDDFLQEVALYFLNNIKRWKWKDNKYYGYDEDFLLKFVKPESDSIRKKRTKFFGTTTDQITPKLISNYSDEDEKVDPRHSIAHDTKDDRDHFISHKGERLLPVRYVSELLGVDGGTLKNYSRKGDSNLIWKIGDGRRSDGTKYYGYVCRPEDIQQIRALINQKQDGKRHKIIKDSMTRGQLARYFAGKYSLNIDASEKMIDRLEKSVAAKKLDKELVPPRDKQNNRYYLKRNIEAYIKEFDRIYTAN